VHAAMSHSTGRTPNRRVTAFPRRVRESFPGWGGFR
jgi:hypothetical protein